MDMKGMLVWTVISGLSICALGYVCLCAYLYWRQDSMIFHPRSLTDSEIEAIQKRYPGSVFYLTMKDGTVIQGYELNKGMDKPLLFYFGGCPEEFSDLLPLFAELSQFHVVLANYRGFGKSQGKPSEDAFFSDALELHDHFAHRFAKGPEDVFVLGRSLGSAVATWLCYKRSVRAAALITPIDSVERLAMSAYPYIPVSVLLKHKFKAEEYARNVNTPVMFLLAENDDVVPRLHSENLIRAWKGKSWVVTVKGVNHATIMNHTQTMQEMKGFFAGYLSK